MTVFQLQYFTVLDFQNVYSFKYSHGRSVCKGWRKLAPLTFNTLMCKKCFDELLIFNTLYDMKRFFRTCRNVAIRVCLMGPSFSAVIHPGCFHLLMALNRCHTLPLQVFSIAGGASKSWIYHKSFYVILSSQHVWISSISPCTSVSDRRAVLLQLNTQRTQQDGYKSRELYNIVWYEKKKW